MEHRVSAVPRVERGAFEIGRPLRPTDIVDGLAETMVLGEGTAGKGWPIAARNPNQHPALEVEEGSPVPALNFWCWPFLNTLAEQTSTRIVATSIFGTTAVPMNQKQVMETIVNTKMLKNCRSGDQTGNAVSGFRSDHPAGAFFLFADGSSRFLSEDAEREIYKALSTIAGAESIQYVD
jgi:hypothetical protein